MGKLYLTILETSFPKPTPKVIDAFHSTLGAIILAKKPLSVASLKRLLPVEHSNSSDYIEMTRRILIAEKELTFWECSAVKDCCLSDASSIRGHRMQEPPGKM
jgi:hypothetical protein